jgi:glycosyltransferase involved in cell wall biosynthesis
MHQSLPFQKMYRFSLLKKEERDCAIRQRLLGMLIKSSVNKADLTLVQTKWICDAVQKFAKRCDKVIPIGFPMPEEPMDCSTQYEAPGQNFFYPAGPAIYKNFSCLNEAVNRLHDEGYTFMVYLTLTRGEFEKLIGNRSMHEKHYCFMGRIPFEKVKMLYHGNTVLYPSYIETLGLPLIEARSSGCYIISSDCPFSHEILDDYENKTYVDPFDSKQLAQAMKTVLDGNAAYISNSSRQFKYVTDCWKRAVDMIDSL